MLEKYLAFIESPNRDTYLAIREEIIVSDTYVPDSSELNYASGLLSTGEYSEARESISGSMPNLLLSPSAHYLLSLIAEKSNDQKSAELEGAIASSCVKGILATGNGTREKPYIVVRISDEYDILHYLSKQIVEKSLIPHGDKSCDLFRCGDGSELCFEITDVLRRRQQISSAVYQVRLIQVGSSRVKVMSLIREIWGLSPSEAKTLIDSPQPLLGTIKSRQRQEIQTKFTGAGAAVEIDGPTSP